MKRGNRRNGRRGVPTINVQEQVAIATADTAVNSTLYTNGDSQPFTFNLASAKISIPPTSGATTTPVWFIIRKVPQGYTAPAMSIASGNVSFADMENVLAYGFYQFQSANTVPLVAYLRILKSSARLQLNDTVVMQVTPGISSAGLVYNAEVVYSTLGH